MQPHSPAPENSSDADTIGVLGSTLMIIQFLLLAVLVFGDFGFDLPGRYGLSFGHFLFFLLLWIISLVGTILCIVFAKTHRPAENEGPPTPDGEHKLADADRTNMPDGDESAKQSTASTL